jgi:hypothetical protein
VDVDLARAWRRGLRTSHDLSAGPSAGDAFQRGSKLLKWLDQYVGRGREDPVTRARQGPFGRSHVDSDLRGETDRRCMRQHRLERLAIRDVGGESALPAHLDAQGVRKPARRLFQASPHRGSSAIVT